jgi:hypothetical protein
MLVVVVDVGAISATFEQIAPTSTPALSADLAISTSVLTTSAMGVALGCIDTSSFALRLPVETKAHPFLTSIASRTRKTTTPAMLGICLRIDALFSTTQLPRRARCDFAASRLTTRFPRTVGVFCTTACLVDLAVAVVVLSIAGFVLGQHFVCACPPRGICLASLCSAFAFADILRRCGPCITGLDVARTAKRFTIRIVEIGQAITIVVLAIATSFAGVFGHGGWGDTIAPQKLLERDGLGFLFAPLALVDFLLEFARADLPLPLGSYACRRDANPRDTVALIAQIAAITRFAALKPACVVLAQLDVVDALPSPSTRHHTPTQHNTPENHTKPTHKTTFPFKPNKPALRTDSPQ